VPAAYLMVYGRSPAPSSLVVVEENS